MSSRVSVRPGRGRTTGAPPPPPPGAGAPPMTPPLTPRGGRTPGPPPPGAAPRATARTACHRRSGALEPRLGRAEVLPDERHREVALKLPFHGLGENGAGRTEIQDRREIPPARVRRQGLRHRPGHGVAHD